MWDFSECVIVIVIVTTLGTQVVLVDSNSEDRLRSTPSMNHVERRYASLADVSMFVKMSG